MNGSREKAADGLQKALGWLYGLILGGSLFVCLFLSHINFSRKYLTTQFLPAFMLLAIGLLLVFSLHRYSSILAGLGPGKRALFIATALLFFLQVFAASQYWFRTAWDVPTVNNTASAIAHGEGEYLSKIRWYFSEFPNNLMLVWIFSLFYRAAHIMGLHEQEYFFIICIQCLLNSLCGLLLVQVVHRLFKSRSMAILGYTLYLFLVGISPWVTVPYSDSMALPFPLATAAIYVNRERCRYRWLPWLCMAALGVIGYRIKPQVLIAFIAVLIAEALRWLKNGLTKESLQRLAAGGCAVIVGIAGSFMFCKLAIRSMNFPVDREGAFGAAHFFMMGLNTETMGAYNGDDNLYSNTFSSVKERNRGNMKLALERIREMGPIGLMKHGARKTLTNYYDGTFAWGGEGYFFSGMNEPKANPFCEFLRGVYYGGEEPGKYYPLWTNFAQMVWLSVLFLAIIAMFHPKNPEKDMMLLSVVGLTLFELLFEARARYLFTYVPIYILLALYGLQFIKTKLERKTKNEV